MLLSHLMTRSEMTTATPFPALPSGDSALTAVGTFRRSGGSWVCDFPFACWLLSAQTMTLVQPWSPEYPRRGLPAGAGPDTTAGFI